MTVSYIDQNRKGKNGRNRTYNSNNRGSCNTDILHMSDYKWCHGSTCHKTRTQDRVRGSKGSKVLRTRKVKQDKWNQDSFLKYFCSHSCYNVFANIHAERIVALAPRNEPLEIPIEDPTKSESYYGGWNITERGVDTWD